MEGVTKKHFSGFLLFSVCMLLAYAIFHGAYIGPWDTDLRKEYDKTRRLFDAREVQRFVPEKSTIRLGLGKPRLNGGNRLVFLGVAGKRMILDVCIPALDPDYAYRHEISVSDAKHGFLINGKPYRLISYSPMELVLKTEAAEKTK